MIPRSSTVLTSMAARINSDVIARGWLIVNEMEWVWYNREFGFDDRPLTFRGLSLRVL
jgi:hypothetical protein